jgi:putative transposase
VDILIADYNLSVAHACGDLQISRRSYYYKPVKSVDEIEEQLLALAKGNPRYGCRKLYQLLRLRDFIVNHKKISRLYKLHKLHLRVKNSKRRLNAEKYPLIVPECQLRTWSCDFVHDKLSSGRKIKALTVIDEFNREIVTIRVEYRINSSRLLQIFEQLKHEYGLPTAIRSDNGREFTATKIQDWAEKNNIRWLFIQPGKPTQNAYCERFNGTYRRELLDTYLFVSLYDAKLTTDAWIDKYNHERPHDSLNGMTPVQYREKYGAKLSNLSCA